MGIFDVFTGAPARRAAEQTRAHLSGVQTQGLADIAGGYGTAGQNIRAGTAGARGDIGAGYDAAFGYAQPAFGQARTDLQGGYGQARDDISGGYGQAQDYLGQAGGAGLDALGRARTEGMGYLGQAGGAYDPLSALGAKYGAGTSTYLDALGVNGAEGGARAQAAFTPSAGYNFTRDQGIEAINRRRNAGGMLNSGNADRDATDYASGLASKEIGGWMDRLGGLVNPELQATSGAATGRAGAFTGMAELARSLGVSETQLAQVLGVAGAGSAERGGISLGQLATGQGTALGGLSERGGTSLGQLATGQGTALGGLASNEGMNLANIATGQARDTTGLRTNLAQPYTNTYGQEAAAQQQGSGNLWSLGLNALTAGAGTFGRNGMFGQGGRFGTPAPYNGPIYGPGN